MSEFIRWNSRSLDFWAGKYAAGNFVDLAARQTHYIKRGNGEPLILLHGFFYDSYLWTANIDALAGSFTVYALDLWGFGYSTRQPLDYGYPLYADQVMLFMDSIGLARASVAGQSMGGGVAIQFCVQHRNRVNKLLLVGAAGLPYHMTPIARLFNLPAVGEFLMGLNTNFIRKKILADQWFHNRELVTDSYFENVTRFQKISGSQEAMLTILRRQFFDKLANEIQSLARMDVPMLLVWGREDKLVPLALGQELQQILKRARLEILDHAGHVPNYECAAAFNQLALDFLQEDVPSLENGRPL